MRTELQRVQDDLDTTTMYVTHDQTEATTMGDRIAALSDSRLQQVGTPLECYHRPANRFVAEFIGEPSMNSFEMEVEGDRLVEENLTYPLSAESADAVAGADRATLGIRPEDVELVDRAADDNAFETAIDVVEPRGTRTRSPSRSTRSATTPRRSSPS